MDPRLRVMLATMQLDEVSYYELLQVAPGVDRSTLQKRFHAFALAFHPDRFADEDKNVQAHAKAVFARGVEAYTVLRNPAATALYDQRWHSGQKRLSAEDFQSLNRTRTAPAASPPPRARKRTPYEGPLSAAMKTSAGKVAAERVDRLIEAERYRDAYIEVGMLEALEPDNMAVRERADTIAAYLKRSKKP